MRLDSAKKYTCRDKWGKKAHIYILKPKRIVQRKTIKNERKTDCKIPNALHEACSRKIFRILDAGEDGRETNRSLRKCCQWGRLTAGRLVMLSRVMKRMVAEAVELGRNSSGVPLSWTHFILIAIYKISMSVIYALQKQGWQFVQSHSWIVEKAGNES